jgi:hypothetical protein
MNPVVQMYVYLMTLLEAAVAVDGPLDGAKIHLFSGNTALTPGLVVGDLTEATFHGYAALSVTWGTPFFDPLTGLPTVTGGLSTFRSTSPFSGGQTINGWYITNTAGDTLLLARKFDLPVGVAAADQVIEVVASVPAYIPK